MVMVAALNSEKRGVIAWLIAMPFLLTPPYAISNRLAWREAMPMPTTFIDQLIPFTPALIWLYMALFPFMWAAVLIQPQAYLAKRVVLSMTCCAFVASVIFVVWPTCFPRDSVVLSGNSLGLSLVHWLDTERNACPSLHGCYAVLSALWIYHARGTKAGLIATVVALGIFYATISVRQHGIIDLVAGGLLGLISYFIWTMSIRQPQSFERQSA